MTLPQIKSKTGRDAAAQTAPGATAGNMVIARNYGQHPGSADLIDDLREPGAACVRVSTTRTCWPA